MLFVFWVSISFAQENTRSINIQVGVYGGGKTRAADGWTPVAKSQVDELERDCSRKQVDAVKSVLADPNSNLSQLAKTYSLDGITIELLDARQAEGTIFPAFYYNIPQKDGTLTHRIQIMPALVKTSDGTTSCAIVEAAYFNAKAGFELKDGSIIKNAIDSATAFHHVLTVVFRSSPDSYISDSTEKLNEVGPTTPDKSTQTTISNPAR
jgi:hypothetical protein